MGAAFSKNKSKAIARRIISFYHFHMVEKYRPVLLVLLVAVVITLLYRFWPHSSKYVRPQSPSKEIVKTLLESPVDLGTKSPNRPATNESVAAHNDLEAKCVAEAMDIARMSLVRVVELVMDDRQELKVCSSSHGFLKDLVSKIKSDCVRKETLSSAQKQTCSAHIALYRALLVDQLTKDSDLTLLPESALLNKAFTIFSGEAIKDKTQATSVVAKTDRIADELLRRRPDWDFAEKLKLAARMVSGDASGMAQIAEKAMQTHPEDADFLEAGFYSMMQGSPKRLLTATENHLRLFPDDPIGHYWMGAAFHALHDDGNASAQVKQATRLDPSNQRYQDTLKGLSTGSSESAFSMQINLPFDGME